MSERDPTMPHEWQELADARAEADRLREALRNYGQHERVCDYNLDGSPCSCGLADALGDTPNE